MGRLVVVRPREHYQQILEGGEIAVVYCCRKRFLDQMIAGDERRVDRTHCRRPPITGRLTIIGQASAPSRGPVVIGGRIGEQAPHGRITSSPGMARSEGRCSTGWCVGPSSPTPIESCVNT
jgi:hypothetical protein